MMRQYFSRTLILLLAAPIWTGCKKDSHNEGARYTITGNGSGNQELPAVNANGTCTVSGAYIAKNKELTYSVSITGLTSNAINIHFHGPAAPGLSAGVLVPSTDFHQAVSGNFSGTAYLTGT